jgi:histidine phosphotransferase ChpT
MASINLLVSELLASRICHDLVGPVGAVNAGVELLEEGGVDEEAVGLLGRSAAQAQQRLQLYRFAFGKGGDRQEFAALKTAAESALGRDGKIGFDWSKGEWAAAAPGMGRLAINAIILLAEALPHGGTIRLLGEQGNVRLAASAEGKRAVLRPELTDALLGKVPDEQLTARTVQAHLTHLIAARTKMRWELSGDGTSIVKLELVSTRTEPGSI